MKDQQIEVCTQNDHLSSPVFIFAGLITRKSLFSSHLLMFLNSPQTFCVAHRKMKFYKKIICQDIWTYKDLLHGDGASFSGFYPWAESP